MYLIIELVLFIITCIFLHKIIKYVLSLVVPKSSYDKYVNKILKDYDRLIVEARNTIDISECKVVDVNSFTELLDVRDNLKMPIIYNLIVKHEKGLFYIKNGNDVYKYIVKGIDLQK